jgi:hypothetical protein
MCAADAMTVAERSHSLLIARCSLPKFKGVVMNEAVVEKVPDLKARLLSVRSYL